MTRDQLWSQLERRGVAGIDTDGLFDTDLHQAVATVETDEHEPGQIVEVIRRGFTMEGIVLRYAQVKVATSPGAAESELEQDAPAQADEEGTESESS